MDDDDVFCFLLCLEPLVVDVLVFFWVVPALFLVLGRVVEEEEDSLAEVEDSVLVFFLMEGVVLEDRDSFCLDLDLLPFFAKASTKSVTICLY